MLLNISTICSGHTKKDVIKFAVEEAQKKNIKFIKGLPLNYKNLMNSQGIYESEKYSEIVLLVFVLVMLQSALVHKALPPVLIVTAKKLLNTI